MLLTAPAATRPLPGAASNDRLFAGWSAATAASALFLLGAGGMVTSTGSGLAVPDWPLSFGQVMPRMTGGVFYEHGHRLVAGVVALMSLTQAVLSLREGVPVEARAACRWAAGLIVVQALLGGLTVLMRLPPAVSISHACLGQAVFCLLLASAVCSTGGYLSLPRDQKAARTFVLAGLAFGAAFLQLALGALLRHAGAAAPLHVLWALAVLLLAAAAAFTALRRGPASLRGAALIVAVVVPAQLALGLLAFRVRYDATYLLDFRAAALWRTAHLVGGAATLGALLVLALRARRLAR
ncbi:MAG: COX15/CtaA family protein [Elusimicrobiota bacterium]|nr:COX15/CtaA family protein [Elusimicrobiota bacterium]